MKSIKGDRLDKLLRHNWKPAVLELVIILLYPISGHDTFSVGGVDLLLTKEMEAKKG